MRFEEVYGRWSESRLSQTEAAELLGVGERQFRRQCRRYEVEGVDSLIDLRIGQVSRRRAPVDEVMALADSYRGRYIGWTAKHFYTKYQAQGGARLVLLLLVAVHRVEQEMGEVVPQDHP